MTNSDPAPDGTGGVTGAEADARAALEQRVRERVGGRLRDLSVTVEAGAVTLDGRADCFHVKQLAQAAVQAVGGLTVKDNRIRVG